MLPLAPRSLSDQKDYHYNDYDANGDDDDDGSDDADDGEDLGVGDAVRLPSVNGSPMTVLTWVCSSIRVLTMTK